MHLPPPLVDPPAERAWPAWLSVGSGEGGGGEGGDSDDELQNWSSLIGIVTAICGNVLIALALNVQRYAHIRLHRRKIQVRERARQAMKNALAAAQGRPTTGTYGTAGTVNGESNWNSNGGPDEGVRSSGFDGDRNGRHSDDDVRDSSETDPLAQSFRSESFVEDEAKVKVASTYLKDPYWWLGQVLITVGEMGNFLAYGFAPASIVSPLGVVALVSNCVIAPIFFKEVFRQRDFWGVIIAVTGAVTVVLSAKTEETKLGPHEVWGAITTTEFEIYMGVTCSLIAFLMWLSPRYGNRTILIDLGLVGLFGGYTALATKGVSSMLSSTLFGAFATPVTYVLVFILLFTAIMQVRYVNKALQRFDSTQVIPIQFVLFTLCVIIGSAVLYRDFERTTLEQAVKFVGGCLFTFFGVFLITSGRQRQDVDEEDALSDAEGIEETIGLAEQDHGIAPPTPPRPSRHAPTPARSRGSSRASRVSFKDAISMPWATLSGAGFPTSRVPHPCTSSQKPLVDDDDDREDSPLLGNPWREEHTITPDRPSIGRHTISSDSVVSAIPSTAASDGEAQQHPGPGTAASTPTLTPQPATITTAAAAETTAIPTITLSTTPPRAPPPQPSDRPTTPRAPQSPPPPATTTAAAAAAASSASPSRAALQQHIYPGPPVISPSPFGSTLSAVVADKLLGHIGHVDGGGGWDRDRDRDSAAHGHGHGHHGYSYSYGSSSGATARARPGLRNSLFVPLPPDGRQGADEPTRGGSVSAVEPGAAAAAAAAGNSNGYGGVGGGGGLRGRARSLSHALGLGGWFGGDGGGGGWIGGGSSSGTAKRAAAATRGEQLHPGGVRDGAEDGGPEGALLGSALARARTATHDDRRGGNASTDTL